MINLPFAMAENQGELMLNLSTPHPDLVQINPTLLVFDSGSVTQG